MIEGPFGALTLNLLIFKPKSKVKDNSKSFLTQKCKDAKSNPGAELFS
jgi:hypothetical protein